MSVCAPSLRRSEGGWIWPCEYCQEAWLVRMNPVFRNHGRPSLEEACLAAVQDRAVAETIRGHLDGHRARGLLVQG